MQRRVFRVWKSSMVVVAEVENLGEVTAVKEAAAERVVKVRSFFKRFKSFG